MIETKSPRSYYIASAAPFPSQPSLEGDLDVDVGIVGGGYTGLSAALVLAERGYRVALLEARNIGWGASGCNGGQINTGFRKGPSEMIRRFGPARARLLFDLAIEARALIHERVERYAIACDLRPGALLVAHRPSEVEWMRSEIEAYAQHFGYSEQAFVPQSQLHRYIGSQAYHGGIFDRGAGHLHPLNYALGLARAALDAGALLFERTPVIAIEEKTTSITLRSKAGSIKAKHVLVACNGYLEGLFRPIAATIMPIANFIIATEPLGEEMAQRILPADSCVCDTRFVVNYFRLSADRRLLWGGGEKYTPSAPPDIPAFVRPHMLKTFPELQEKRVDYGWSAMLAITMNRLPHIGRRGNIFFAQGYSGQGVALSGFAGKLVAEAIAGTAERFDILSAIPHRSFPGGDLLRHPLMVLGMIYYALRDRL